MKTQPWQLETGAYPFSIRFNPHYSHLDTERHVNNVAVQSFHTEARTRFHMAVLGDRAWYSDDVLLRPRRTVTHFLRETHYPHEVTAAVRLVLFSPLPLNVKKFMTSSLKKEMSLLNLKIST